MTDSAWNWNRDGDGTLVIPAVRAVAVYTNPSGDIVIRQEGSGYGDSPEDQVVVVPRSMINTLIKAVKAESAKKFDPTED